MTDNATVAASGRDVDLVTTASAGLSLSGDGARIQLSLSYDLSADKYVEHTELDGFRHNLTALGNAELVRGRLFLDIRGAISEVSTQRNQGTSATERSIGGNRSRIFNYSISPRFEHRFGDVATATVVYRLSQTIFGNTDAGNSGTAPGGAVEHFGRLSLGTGSRFARLIVGGNVSHSESIRKNTTNSTRTIYDINLSFVLNPKLTLLATAGYEKFGDAQISSQKLGGAFGHAGFRYKPGPRTDLHLEIGHRFDDIYYTGDASYIFPGGATLTARYRMDVVTQQQTLSNQLADLQIDADGNIVNSLSQQQQDPNSLTTDFTDQTLKTQTFNMSLNIPRQRNSYSATAIFVNRELPSGGKDNVLTLSGVFSRSLTPRRTVRANISYSEALQSGLGNGDDRRISGGLSLTDEIGRSINGVLRYSFLYSDNLAGSEVLENTLMLSLRFKF